MELSHDGQPLTVCTTHLRWSPPETPLDQQWASRQVGELHEHLCSDVSTILCGDFNFTSDHPLMAELASRDLRCAFENNNPATFNSRGVPRKIDYLLHNSYLTAQPETVAAMSATTPLPSATEPSDHLPLVATFTTA